MDDSTSHHVKIIVGATDRKQNLVARYRSLEKQMRPDVYEEPVFLNDFAPTNTRLRYVYFHEPFKIEVFSFHYGNNLGTLWYAWRIPDDIAKYDPKQTEKKIAQVKQNVKQYHSRKMRRQLFSEQFGLVFNAKPSVMSELYQLLTRDASATSISDGV